MPRGPVSRLPTLIERKPLTAKRAARIIGAYTLLITIAGGVLARVVDHRDFHSLGAGIWWALQTVTTVGYGDVVPHSTAGRAVGVVVMVSGIGFLTVITASVTAALIEAARARGAAGRDEVMRQLDEVAARLEAIEARLPDG
jgi:voltage-gated potassium channel Kch